MFSVILFQSRKHGRFVNGTGIRFELATAAGLAFPIPPNPPLARSSARLRRAFGPRVLDLANPGAVSRYPMVMGRLAWFARKSSAVCRDVTGVPMPIGTATSCSLSH